MSILHGPPELPPGPMGSARLDRWLGRLFDVLDRLLPPPSFGGPFGNPPD